jgi:hypothetical protein
MSCLGCSGKGTHLEARSGLVFCGQACQFGFYSGIGTQLPWLAPSERRLDLIGDKQDQDKELAQRLAAMGSKGTPVSVLAGPHKYAYFRIKDQDIWLFGEQHGFVETQNMRARLNIILDRDGIRFTGENPRIMDMARYFYAVAAASVRQERQVDIFLELFYWEQRKEKQGKPLKHPVWKSYHSDDREAPTVARNNILNKMHIIINGMRCGELNRARSSDCEVYPWTRFHFADYRTSGSDTGYSNYNLDETGFSLEALLMNLIDVLERDCPKGLIPVLKFMRAIDESGAFRAYRKLWLTSDTFAPDCVRLFAPHVQALVAALTALGPDCVANALGMLQLLQDETLMAPYLKDGRTPARKQLSALVPDMADRILGYFLGAPAAMVTTADLFLSTVWIMDVALLSRLFRTFGAAGPTGGSKVKFVYAGAAHIDTYAEFLGILTNSAIPLYKTYRRETMFDPLLRTRIEGIVDTVTITDPNHVKMLNSYIQ